jgi:hypothetical protein
VTAVAATPSADAPVVTAKFNTVEIEGSDKCDDDDDDDDVVVDSFLREEDVDIESQDSPQSVDQAEAAVRGYLEGLGDDEEILLI